MRRTFSYQYPASSSAPSIHRPSAVEYSRARPADGRTPASPAARIGASSATPVECATKSVSGTRHRIACRAESSVSNSVSASRSPDTTVAAGPFTAATASRSPHGAIRPRTRSSGMTTESIPPCAPRPDSARLRIATTRAASSRLRIPATVAAAISPWECPSTASGVTPAVSHTAASDTITAHSTGCTTSA